MSWAEEWNEESSGSGITVWRHPDSGANLLDAPTYPGEENTSGGIDVVIRDRVVSVDEDDQQQNR